MDGSDPRFRQLIRSFCVDSTEAMNAERALELPGSADARIASGTNKV